MRPLQPSVDQASTFRHFTIAFFSASLLIFSPAGLAQSSLLESVKRNPAEAKALCQSFETMNSNGQSALSPEAINQLASERNLSTTNAEILATYVIGMHCSDVR